MRRFIERRANKPALNTLKYKLREIDKVNRHTEIIGHLEHSVGDNRLRRALAARLDSACKRASVSSAQAANWLGVSEVDVDFWRRGITVPPLNACKRLAAVLNLDVHWLCTGQPQVA